MKKSKRTTEQIIRILREADTGITVDELCRKHQIGVQSYYRWKRKYGGMDVKEAQRLRELEKENTELKKLLADHVLQVQALKIVIEKNV